MFDLAQRVWDLSQDATLVKLRSLVGPPNSDYDSDGAKRHRRQIDLHRKTYLELEIQSAQAAARPGTTQLRLLEKAKLRCSDLSDSARASISKVLGVVDAKQASRLLIPTGVVESSKGGHAHGRRVVFSGGNWSDVIALPLRTVPGRPDGFWFVGRKLSATDTAVDWFPTGVQGSRYGLAYNSDLLSSTKTITMLYDPMQYLRVQVKHARTNPSPADYALSITTKGLPSKLAQFPQAKATLWSQQLTSRVLFDALSLNADISMAGPRVKTSEEWLRWSSERGPDEIARCIASDADHWTNVISRYVKSASDRNVEQLVLELQGHGAIEELLSRLDYSTKDRMSEYMPITPKTRNITFNSTHVTEKNGKWIGNGRWAREDIVITDAPFRIEKIFTYGEKTMYAGYVTYKGKTVPFAAERNEFERSPGAFISKLLISKRLGIAEFNSSHSWTTNVLLLANRFHTPTFDDSITYIGWDDTGTLALPQHRFGSVAGKAKYDPPEWFEGLPAGTIPPPSLVDIAKLENMGISNPGNRSFWAIASACVANALAPGAAQEARGVIITGPGAVTAASTLMRYLGVCSYNLMASSDVDKLWKLERQSDWPSCFVRGHGLGVASLQQWYTGLEGGRACFAVMEPAEAAVMAADGWTIVDLEAGLGNYEYGAAAVSAYMQDWFSRMHAGKIKPDGNWLQWIRSDMIAWAKRNHVKLAALDDCKESTFYQDDAPDYWSRVVLELVRTRQLPMGRTDLVGKATAVRLEDDGVWVPENVCARLRVLPMDQLAWLMQKQGALIERCDRKAQPGFLLDAGWWKKQCKKYLTGPTLKVIG